LQDKLILSINVKYPVLLNDLSWFIINIGDDEVAFDDLNLDMEGLNLNMDDCSSAVRVRTLHISSLILAAKSPFFYKVDVSSLLD
jgi:hypothetical protein